MSGFTIPNTPDALNQNQAEPDSLDFRVLGNQVNGVVSGMAITPGSAETVNVASGEVLINGSYYSYTGASVNLTAYASSTFFDIIVARLSGSTITCYAIAGNTGTNPRFPTTVNLSTDVVLASVWRTNSSAPSSNAITDKRVFVRSNTNRVGTTPTGGNHADTWVQPTSWTPSTNLSSPLSIKVGSTWYNLARYSENFSAGTITANLVGNVIGTVTGNVTGTAGSVAWSNITSLPALVYNNGGTYSINITGTAGAVAWANVSGKPAISYNDGGTYSINITGAASSAGYLTPTVNVDPFGGPYFGWSVALGQWSVSGQTFFGGKIFLGSATSSNSEEVLVRISTGEVKTRLLPDIKWSLRHMKDDIQELTGCLDKLETLQPKTFIFKEEFLHEDKNYRILDRFDRREQLQYGFIVDEIEESSVPDLVQYRINDENVLYPRAWKTEGLLAIAVGAIKEMSQKIKTLESRIEALEA